MRREDLSIGTTFDPPQFSLDSTFNIIFPIRSLGYLELFSNFHLSVFGHQATCPASRLTVMQRGQRNFAKRNFAKRFAKFLFRISRNFRKRNEFLKTSRNFAKLILKNCTETNLVYFLQLNYFRKLNFNSIFLNRA